MLKIKSEDQLEFITEGRFFVKNGSLYLTYEESELSGMVGCTTSLKITGDKIKMKRYGDELGTDTSIEFEKGARFNGTYSTPFGDIPMEVLTSSVDNNLTLEGNGRVDIDYMVSLKGLSENRTKLSIEILPDGSVIDKVADVDTLN
ncbi:MAG: DUF1934 domain-containing protein [Clostridiales Family XIII bacterium]|nr:DUF1934 domain-containing protein [Clostridiales Family XIII bacterium]